MRRADRLFRIVEYLKARREAVTADELAAEMQIGVRTIYRDVADLRTSGVPIVGEAGVGYLLRREYVLRPLMFDVEELEALALGAQIVESWGDTELARSARQAMDKITAVLPDDLAADAAQRSAYACASRKKTDIHVNLSTLRRAIRSRHCIEIDYISEGRILSSRKVRPLCVVFIAPVWLLAAWCELRQDFREFRIDRIQTMKVLSVQFPNEPGRTLKDLQRKKEQEYLPH
ncbi:MAG: YafY family transcriptional regulator [Planctomycetaceae bacterium]|nr:YafY family transcriptional regulator [Planctomycetaceae bacterium]